MWSNYLIFGITWLTFYPIKCIDIHVRHILVIIFWKLRENGTNVESSLGPLKTVCRKIVANVKFARIGPTVDALGLCTV
jgi:hypothetical protein